MNTCITPTLLASSLLLSSGVSYAQPILQENKNLWAPYKLQSHTIGKVEDVMTYKDTLAYQDIHNRRTKEVEKMEQDANTRFGGDLLTFQGDSTNWFLRPAIRVWGNWPLREWSISIRLSSKDDGRVTLVYRLKF